MSATTGDVAKWGILGSAPAAFERLVRNEVSERGRLVIEAIRSAFETDAAVEPELESRLMVAYTALLEEQCADVRERYLRAARSISTGPERAEKDAFDAYRAAVVATTHAGYRSLGHLVKALESERRATWSARIKLAAMLLLGAALARANDVVAFVVASLRHHR